MIIIEKPRINDKNTGDTEISVTFKIDDQEKKLWYTVPTAYKQYLVTENLDAFLVALLFLGLKKGEDIHLTGAVSARLLYNVNHYLIAALCLANNKFKPIRV